MASPWGEGGDYTELGYSYIARPSGRVLAGREEGEGFAMHELGVEKVDDGRKIATHLSDRRDHLDLYRRMSDS
jgi:predicted amidohydrolase